ncbi:TVP38/TMEM64 family protein [Sporomusa sp.]|uniref:TVP38/TMEM64 family protein n=1 Tax=Sporomusa sp. TaxID=2078658 RepID=UPI002C6F700E|nr:TVP38/TMEM64 family protein [Sporomusa sp.]HWR43954.1 TVP38/TMEM64 family protein [Sporomusa sp.]
MRNPDETKTELRIKLMAVLLLVMSFGAIHLYDPALLPKLWALTISGDVNALTEILRSYGIWAMLISMVIDILINAVGFLPSIFISTANGILFGIIPGIIISWLAECIGVIISFLLMRSLLRDQAQKLIERSPYLKKVDEFSGRNGFQMMLFARTLPYFPSGIITALGAVSSISVKDYTLANFIGKLPSTALEVVVGHDVVNYEQNLTRLTVIVLGVALVYGGIIWLRRKRGVSEKEPVQYDRSDTPEGED